MRGAVKYLGAFFLLAPLLGCSSIGGTAIRTGPLRLPAREGPVAIYVLDRPRGATDLGVVEVHALQREATVDTLFPVFARKVASIGGNAAVLEHMGASFEVLEHWHVESYTYPCGYYATCVGTRTFPAYEEVMILTLSGHAMLLPQGQAPGAAPRAPLPAPSAPPAPPPANGGTP